MSDPHRLAEALIIERDDVARFINIEDLAVTQAPASGAATAGEKFVFFAPERDLSTAATNAPVRLSLGLRSGARVAFAEGPSLLTPDEACKAVLDSISTWHSANKTAAYAEAAVRGHMREWLAPAARFNVIDLGAPPAHPSASVVVPFDGVSDLVRCRMGMFALDAAMADIEVIYVTESAAQYRLAERLLGDLRSAYGLPLRLIVPDRELPKGALLGGALRSARIRS